ncbi:Sedlin [Xylariaceae sp. FL0594]|nr:Sedlin [Xylariaceae sp. FL0594]
MATTIPSIACLGVIGRNNNPLHITIFPSYDSTMQTFAPVRTPLQFSLLLSGTLDVFGRQQQHASSSSNPSATSASLLLHAVDDRLAAYGFETNTGVKFVAVVDMRGRSSSLLKSAVAGGNVGVGVGVGGLRDSELKPVFRAMQTAYVRLLQNPFYDPDESTGGKKRITSQRFADEMKRIGESWVPGATTAL